MSAIVRTVGRDTLPRTLESIERQTWRPIEIVLVQAREHLAEPVSSLPLRVVGQRALDRPRAANAGLEAASGEWLWFIDEDDTVEPDHVASLMKTALESHASVAYGQTRLLDAHGTPQRVFGGPFRREMLQRSNYLSIHAVIFTRRFVDEGVRFDESLATFEDWDFWLQLAQRCDFAFMPRATAIYRASAGTSGAGAGPNLDREAVLQQRAKLMRKWGLE